MNGWVPLKCKCVVLLLMVLVLLSNALNRFFYSFRLNFFLFSLSFSVLRSAHSNVVFIVLLNWFTISLYYSLLRVSRRSVYRVLIQIHFFANLFHVEEWFGGCWWLVLSVCDNDNVHLVHDNAWNSMKSILNVEMQINFRKTMLLVTKLCLHSTTGMIHGGMLLSFDILHPEIFEKKKNLWITLGSPFHTSCFHFHFGICSFLTSLIVSVLFL